MTASAHLQRFTEALLKPFSSSTFEYETTDSQGAKIVATAFGMAMGYIDDCCVVTFGTVEEHEILLRRVLSAMQKQNVRLTPAKCEFFRTSAAFLGHVLSAEGISQQDKKLDAIKKWPIPTDLKQMRAFVSLCSYYRKFVHKFAEIAKPLTDLLRDGGWHYPFSAEVLQAIDKLKTALTTAPVLRYFDYLAKTELYVDACDYAIGAVLQQVDSEGNSHPVGYYSRRLNPAECNYDVYKKELLGLRDAVLNFRHQLLGIRFTVFAGSAEIAVCSSRFATLEFSAQIASLTLVSVSRIRLCCCCSFRPFSFNTSTRICFSKTSDTVTPAASSAPPSEIAAASAAPSRMLVFRSEDISISLSLAADAAEAEAYIEVLSCRIMSPLLTIASSIKTELSDRLRSGLPSSGQLASPLSRATLPSLPPQPIVSMAISVADRVRHFFWWPDLAVEFPV